jgi:hypothetical protein
MVASIPKELNYQCFGEPELPFVKDIQGRFHAEYSDRERYSIQIITIWTLGD